jgi:hypothetical protein
VYSGGLRVSIPNGLSIELGAGRPEVPGFFGEGQANYQVAGWKATSESIQFLRIGYRFVQAMETDPCSTVSSSFSGSGFRSCSPMDPCPVSGVRKLYRAPEVAVQSG